jgi:hypothetical protein
MMPVFCPFTRAVATALFARVLLTVFDFSCVLFAGGYCADGFFEFGAVCLTLADEAVNAGFHHGAYCRGCAFVGDGKDF